MNAREMRKPKDLEANEEMLCVYLGYWERMLSAARLSKLLNRSREHVSRHVLARVRKKFRLSDPQGSLKFSTILEEPEHLPSPLRDPRALMNALPGLRALTPAEGTIPEIHDLRGIMAPEVDTDNFAACFSAMQRREAVLMDYRAKTGVFALQFSPHNLVDLPFRSHFRGHAFWPGNGKSQFIDMVPSRIVQIHESSSNPFVSGRHDEDWSVRKTLELALFEGLPSEIRETVIQEWGNQTWDVDGRIVLRIPGVRRALEPYVRDAMMFRSFQGVVHQIWT